MGRALLIWELGAGLGHLVNLKPIAEGLLSRGHQVFLAVRDSARVDVVFERRALTLVEIPPLRLTNEFPQPASFAHFMLNAGFGIEQDLLERTLAWRHIMARIQPDLIVCDHSPGALFATRGLGGKRAIVGTGFFTPPRQTPLPFMRPIPTEQWALLHNEEERLLQSMNRVLRAVDSPGLASVADLFHEVDELFLATYPELDHYGVRNDQKYWGAWPEGIGEPPRWPPIAGKRVFAYLKPFPALEELLHALRSSGEPTLVVADGISPTTQASYATRSLGFLNHPLELAEVAATCDLAILNANHGTTVAMLLAGKPILQIPLHLEQRLLATAVERMGAGAWCVSTDSRDVREKLSIMLATPDYQRAAQSFSARYASIKTTDWTGAVVERVAQLMPLSTATIGPNDARRSKTQRVDLSLPRVGDALASSFPTRPTLALDTPTLLRVDPHPGVSEQWEHDPRRLLHPHRFDVAAKMIYAKFQLWLGACDWPRRVYVEHLRVLNNCWEASPPKRSSDDFEQAFVRLLTSMANDGFDSTHGTIAVGCDGALLNGAHRLAACIALGVPALITSYPRAGLNFSAAWFKRRTTFVKSGLPIWCADAMALEYLRNRDAARIVVVVSRSGRLAGGSLSDASFVRGLVYGRTLRMTRQGLQNLAHIADAANLNANWNAQIEPVVRLPMADDSSERALHLFLLDGEKLDNEKLDGAFQPASLLGPDDVLLELSDWTRSMRVAETVFTRPGRHFLMRSQLGRCPRFDRALTKLDKQLIGQASRKERICIHGDGVRAVYGRGDCDRVEYVELPLCPSAREDCESSVVTPTGNRLSAAEAVVSAERHFYYRGFKFLAIDSPTA